MNKIVDPFTNKEIDFIDPFTEKEQPKPENDKGGMASAFGAGVDKLQELGYRAVKGFTDVGNEGDGFLQQGGALANFAQEGIDRNIKEQKAYQPSIPSHKDINPVGDFGQLIANSGPYMVAAMTPIGAATMAGGLSQEAYHKEIDFIDPFTGKEQLKPENGKGGMARAFGAGVDKSQELGYRAVKGFTDVGGEGDGFLQQGGALANFAQEGIDRNIEEQKAYQPSIPSYKDIHSVGDFAQYAGELIANSVPSSVASMTPIGAATMAGGLSQEAYEEQPEGEKNATRAIASGVGQVALERLGNRFAFGAIGKSIMKDGFVQTAKKFGKGELINIRKDPASMVKFGKRVLFGAMGEGATEGAQEALAMWGAGIDFDEFKMLNHDPSSDDILGSDGQILMENFVGGAVAGGGIRAGIGSAQRLISWHKKTKPIAKNGIEELVKQGVPREEAIKQVSDQLIETGINQGLNEAEAAASAARIMKMEYGIDHEIFTPVANDVASRRSAMNERLNKQRIEGGIGDAQQALQKGKNQPTPEELIQQQMQARVQSPQSDLSELEQMQANDPEFFKQAEKAGLLRSDQQNDNKDDVNKVTKEEDNLHSDENRSNSEKPQKTKIKGLEVVEAPIDELSLSNDVPQFKEGANDKGVVEPLGGKFERTGVAPIQVWIRKNGDKEVISGRHRLDLAKRSGEQTIPAQYHYETDGFSKQQAASLDALLNVREGQGKVKDYVQFIQHTKPTEKEAESSGILARATGKRAYTIANFGSDALIAAHRNDGVTDEGAARIAQTAPNNESLQAVGIKALDEGKTIAVAENLVKAVKSMTNDQQQSSGDLFGFDDSAMVEAENLAKAASKKQAEIQKSLSAIKGAARNPKLAAKEGVNVKDPKAVNKRIEQLQEEKRQWDNWHTNPYLVAQLKDKPNIPTKQTTNEQAASQEAVVVSEPQENVKDDNKTDLFSNPLDQAANEAATSPTNDLKEPSDAQKEAGNYKKGRVSFSGIDIAIKNKSKNNEEDAKADDSEMVKYDKPSDEAKNIHEKYEVKKEGFDLGEIERKLSPAEIVVTHSGGKIKEIKSGVFDGLFGAYGEVSSGGLSVGENYQTSFAIEKSKIAREGDIDLDYDKSIDWLKKEFPDKSDDEIDAIYEWVAEDKADPWTENLLSDKGFTDEGEASWEAQRLRGQLALSQGFDAVEMRDETGISVLIPKGSKAKFVGRNYDLPELEIKPDQKPQPIKKQETSYAVDSYRNSRKSVADKNITNAEENLPSDNIKLVDFMVKSIKQAEITNNNHLKKMGAQFFGLEKASDVTPLRLKRLQEAFEVAQIMRRRNITQKLLKVAKNKAIAIKKIFETHVAAYKKQPNLDVRTKQSAEFQAYSTPAPMAFLSNIAAGIDANTTVFEPTAGNGLLLLTASPENTFANELDPVRAESLAYTGFNVSTLDATNDPFTGAIDDQVDVVIANPPFGRLRDDNGKPTDFVFTDKQGKQRVFKEIDHVIAYQALEAMKDDGKAALILGAPKEAGDYKGNNKIFLNWLYQNYNIEHHIEVDGKLYKGQGAAWPLQMITINGRALEGTGKFAPTKGQVERLTSWEAIYDNYKQHGLLDTKNKQFKFGRKSNGNVSDSKGTKVIPLSDRANDSRGSNSGTRENAVSGKTGPRTVLPDNRSTRISADASVGFDSQPDISEPRLDKTGSKPNTRKPSNTVSKPTDSVGLPGERTSEPVAKQKGHNSKPKQISTKVKKINDFQAEYQTASDGFNDKVLTPVNIASYTQSALIDIQNRHGSIDNFVMDRLGYDNKEDLHKSFMGLQADSIALAVDAIEKGRGIIIGDQTGIGKGRQAAGIIRYALKNGKTPIFVSQKPNLFTDMFDDLGDIGVDEFSPLIVNQDKGYISKDGKKLFNHSETNRKKLMNEVTLKAKLPDGYDALFMTYSQISSDKTGSKTKMVDGLLDNAILVMDESHTAAGGMSKLGKAFQGFVSKAAGVTYLSATYAKRPDNMLLYMRTDLGLATDNHENLVSAVQSGGLGMQTYIASKLAEAGQMVRRERSFDGISIKDNVIKDSSGDTVKLFDQTTEALRAIQETSAYWKNYVERVLADDIQRQSGLDTRVSGNQADTAINVTLFSSVVHNYIRQLTLGLKAKDSAKLAIKAIQEGKRPIIALESTLGSALKAYMTKYGKVTGDYADNLDFSTMLESVLDNTLAYSTKEPGDKKGTKTLVSINNVSDPMVQEMYQKAITAIKKIDSRNIPASPIDAMRYEITKAGYSVAEITGRDLIIDYDDNAKIVNRPAAENNRRDIVDQFNKSKVDVIILNQAGSTGLSLHASEKLAKEHQKPRYMVIAEPSLDVNVYMQMLGRANRTGQVELPSYDNAWLDLPSEKRPAAVISRKMKGLNANTSGNIDSATSVDSIDILNIYGDEVVRNYTQENKNMLASYNPKLVALPKEDTANYFLGKIAVLPVKIQEKVLNEIEAAYKDHMDFLNATGQNQLNNTSLDLEAKPLSQKVIAESRSSAGVFAEPVYLTKVLAKAQGKAPSWDEVNEALSDSSQADFDSAINAMIDDEGYSKTLSERLASLQEKEQKALLEGKKANSYTEQINTIKQRKREFEADKQQIANDFGEHGIYSYGSFVNVMPNDTFERAIPGVVIGLDYKHEVGNPTAKSKWKLKVMVADRMRTIPINLNRAQDGVIQGKRFDSPSNLKKVFDQVSQLPQTETRHIMTGNLVEATTSTAKQGRIVPFSTHDGRIIQGLLLPASFNPKNDVKEKTQATTEDSVKWLLNVDDDILASMGLSTSDKAVTVRRKRWGEGYSVEMPKSAAKGKKYWGNEAIEAIIGEQAVKGGGTFSVDLTEDQVLPFAQAMKQINNLSIQGQAQIKSFNKMFNKESDDFVDSGIVFSRSSSVSPNANAIGSNNRATVSEAHTHEVINSIVASSSVLGHDDFVVASTFNDLPSEIKEAAKDQGADGSIKGAFHKGKTYLVRDKLADAKEVESTIFHETYGHHGIRKLFGKELPKVLNQLLQGIGGIKGIERITKKHNIDLSDYKKGLADSSLTNEQAQTVLMDELLAHLAQDNRPSIKRKVREVIGAIRQWLKKSGFINLNKISDSELFYVLKQARESVISGDNNTIIINDNNPSFSRAQSNSISLPDETTKDRWLRRVQDKFIRLKITQETLDNVNDSNNASQAEEALHGKVAEGLRQIEKEYTDNIAKTMAENNLTQEEVDLYLIAKHAEERNAYIDTINPELEGRGSGMSNDEAQAILDKALIEEKRLALESVANQVYAMLQHARDEMVKYGLESQDNVDAWQEQYKYYVPLKGYAKGEATHATNHDGSAVRKYGTGKGFNIKGRETMRAMGRRTLAESPLLHSIADTTQAIIRARKNEVGNTFLKLVQDNPDSSLWEVFDANNPDTKRGTKIVDGQEVVAQVPMTAYEMKASDDYFKTKVDGVEHFIKIHDPLLLRAMGNLGVDQINTVTRTLGTATQLLSAMVTAYNPEFILTNSARDIQTAVYNVLAETQVADGKAKNKKLALNMVKSIPKALVTLRKGFRNGDFSDPEWGSYLKEFLESGAKTGWVNQKDINELAKELKSTIARSSNTNKGKALRVGKSIADFVHDYNDIVENATRFSVYYHARKQGVSVEKASSLAKNLTINFNRKGEWGNTMNAFYMFANASVQGTANMLRAIATPKDRSKSMWNPEYYNTTQKLALGVIGGTVIAANAMRMLGGDDDDGVPLYDKIPDYVKAANFVILTGGKDENGKVNYVPIPMPYGYNVLANIGHAIDGVIQGKPIPKQAANLFLSVVSAFSPIGVQESDSMVNAIVKTTTPTVGQPFMQIALNENFYGGQIYPDQKGYGTHKADSHLGDDYTWEWTKGLTEWLNDNTGGSTFRSGAIDITPQAIDHLLKFMGGGAFQFVARWQNVGAKYMSGKEIESRDVPFLRRFYKQLNPKASIGSFYDDKEQLDKYLADFKMIQRSDKAEFLKKYRPQLELQAYSRGIEKALRNLNKQKRNIEASRLSESDKEEKIRLIDDKKIELTMRFSKKKNSLGIKSL